MIKMFQLDSSYELLSSMSPKINKSTKRSRIKKSPCKLSLKKNLRKSAIFDTRPNIDFDESVILIEDSFEDKKQISKTNIKINKVDLVSLSSESISDSCDSEKENTVPRFTKVDNWLSENDKAEGISEIHSFKHKTFFDSDIGSVSSRSSFDKLSDGDENQQKTDLILYNTEKITLQENILAENKNNDTFRSKESFIDNSFDENIENYENILDSLYGHSWREKKDDILPKSERKPAKKPIKITAPKTERKPNRTKLFETKKRPNSILTKLKNICDSDSSSDSYKSFTDNKFYSTSEDDMTQIKTKKPTRVKKLTKKKSDSSDSSGINLSDIDLDLNTSLRTRVQNKLLKNNVLKEFSSTPKKKLILKENNNKTDKQSVQTEKKISTNSKIEYKTVDNKTKKSTNVIVQTEKKNNKEETKFSFLYSLSDCLPSWQSDPDARFYRDNFAKEKENLAKRLFEFYNEEVFKNALPKDTLLEWNSRINKTAGMCYNRRITRRDGRVERLCRIVLAPKVLTCAARLRDTLLHEMCHAATWIINGVADGHGPQWRAWANKAQTTFPELPPVRVCHNYVIQTKFTYQCQGCGYSIGRHSKSLDIERKRCGICLGAFQLFVNKKGKGGDIRRETVQGGQTSKKPPFADFVKEHYKNVRKGVDDHAQAMKILGQQFKEMKLNK